MNYRTAQTRRCVGLTLIIALLATTPVAGQFGGGEVSDWEKRLTKLESKVNHIGKWMNKLKESPLGSSEEPEVKVFRLQYTTAPVVAQNLQILLGEEGYRLAIDENSNVLIVSAPPATSQRIEAVIRAIDIAPATSDGSDSADRSTLGPKSLMVRIFWLSQGQADSDSPPAADYLPGSVIDALTRVGLTEAYVVSQSNSTVAFDTDSKSRFNVGDYPVRVDGQLQTVNAQGEITVFDENSMRLEIDTYTTREVSVNKQLEFVQENEIHGSIVAPIGHFSVLGTTNYSPTKAGTVKKGALVIQMLDAQTFSAGSE